MEGYFKSDSIIHLIKAATQEKIIISIWSINMKVMVVGTFDVDNYGDCIFPDIVQNELKKRLEDVEFQFYSPTSKKARIGNYKEVRQLPGTIDECKNIDCDSVILAGGEVLTQGHNHKDLYCVLPPNTMSAGMRLWMTPALIKLFKNVPFVINAVGIGSIDDEVKTGLNAALTLADFKLVRDQLSYDFLNNNGCKVNIGIDCGFLIPRLHSIHEWEQIAKNVIPENLSQQSYLAVQIHMSYIQGVNFEVWVRAVVEIAETANLSIVLMPICYHHSDLVTLHKCYLKIKKFFKHVYLIDKFLKTDEIASIIFNSGGYCGSSLHGAITSIAFNRPLAVLTPKMPYKHDGVLRTVGIEGVVTTRCEELPEAFIKSLSLNLSNAAFTGVENADAAFDQIASIIKTPLIPTEINESDWIHLKKAIYFDSSYYNNKPFYLFLRFIFSIIRTNVKLNGYYDTFSSWKNNFLVKKRISC